MLDEGEIFSSGKLVLLYGDMTDSVFMYKTIGEKKPEEIYNLAAQTHVKHSFDMPHHTYDVNIKGILNIC